MDRYKEAQPQDTVAHVKELLAGVGLDMQGQVHSCVGKLFSVHIVDKATGFSTNGKGASRDLCLASAFGEAMERLQNHYGFRGFQDDEVDQYLGFVRYPGETSGGFDRVLDENPFVLNDMGQCFESGKTALAREYWRRRGGDELLLLPYYQVGSKKTTLLPDRLISDMAGSNGLCAGNTPEEALCEGMHELCERYAKGVVLEGECCLPDIPRAFLDEHCPVQVEMIRVIEESFPGSHIVVKDASFGQGLPVVCIVIIDRQLGRYHIKFGSHLRIDIALERCLTELFQGFDPSRTSLADEALTTWDRASRKAVHNLENGTAMERSDVGSIPDKILLSRPDWEFVPWGTDAFDNKAGLRALTDKLQGIGGDVFIRDMGYLGFPAYRIYVPKMSVGLFIQGPDKDRCVWLDSRFKRKVGFAILAFERGDNASAVEYLRSTNQRQYLCAAQEISLAEEGYSEEERDQLLAQFFGRGIARHVALCWRSEDVAAALIEQREKAVEFVGAKAESSSADSKHAAIAALKRTLKERMVENPIDQQRIGLLYQ